MRSKISSHGSSSRKVMPGCWRFTAWLPAVLAAAPLLGCEYYDFGDGIHGDGHGHSGGGKKGCEYGGARYRAGDSFPSTDGCNQCSCQANGTVVCTLRACADTCGGLAGVSCPEGQYCNFPAEAQCGAADQTGSCAVRPEGCTKEFAPVCGCDDVTYGNACTAAAAGVSVASQGECGSGSGALQIGDACGGFRPPNAPDCDKGLFCQHQPGALCGAADAPGECVAIPEVCTDIFDPVCGCDGQTYANACEAAASQVGILARGECE